MLDFINGLLDEEGKKKLAEKLGDKKLVVNDGNYVPRSELNAKNDEVKDLRKQISDRDRQLDELKTKAAGNESLQKQIEDLKAENQKTKDDFESKLQVQAFDHTLEKAIQGTQAKNVAAVKALLKVDGIKLDGDKLLGFDDQIKAIKESDAYLFNDEKPGGSPGSAGNANRQTGGSDDSEGEFAKGLIAKKQEQSKAIDEGKDLYFK